MDQNDILRVAAETNIQICLMINSTSGKTDLAHLIIRAEHLKLPHAGPTLTYSSISLQFHLIGGMKCIKSVIHTCAICQRYDAKPEQQQVGQLPKERLTPGHVFSKVGVDYAGPLLIKDGPTQKPTVRKYVRLYGCQASGASDGAYYRGLPHHVATFH